MNEEDQHAGKQTIEVELQAAHDKSGVSASQATHPGNFDIAFIGISLGFCKQLHGIRP